MTLRSLRGGHRTLKVTSITGNCIYLLGSVMLASAFFNRWLVVDVPPGWQLVSQVLLALHITLLRGESLVVLAESAVLSRCIILLTTRRVPNFSPAWLLASHKRRLPLSFSHNSSQRCYHLPPSSLSTFTSPSFYQSSSPLSLSLSLEGCSNTDRSH